MRLLVNRWERTHECRGQLVLVVGEPGIGKSRLFFFSSRRRHTRWNWDWSSDVCSSDLWELSRVWLDIADDAETNVAVITGAGKAFRSEERRVGKECRCRWSPALQKQ